MRALHSDVVDQLVESIRERGLINPITVRRYDLHGYWLIAGLHRLMAVKQLKKATIRCQVLEEVTADEAELIEIDENLIRADLSPAERAMHVGRRKELYEKLHPQTKHGGDRKSAKARSSPQVEDSFAKHTAKKTGRSRQSVERDAARASKVTVLADIAGTSLDQGDEIDALAKLPTDEQRKLAERAKAGERITAKTADAAASKSKAPKEKPRTNGATETGEQRKERAAQEVGQVAAKVASIIAKHPPKPMPLLRHARRGRRRRRKSDQIVVQSASGCRLTLMKRPTRSNGSRSKLSAYRVRLMNSRPKDPT